jgi:hypothetical protein
MLERRVETSNRIDLLYDDRTRHHVIGNVTGAMAKQLVCKACRKSCSTDRAHTCYHTCSDCMASPPCVHAVVRIPCAYCNRHFRSQSCFANHKLIHGKKKSVCDRKHVCPTLMHSLNPLENMNVANTLAKNVKPSKRNGISAICSC